MDDPLPWRCYGDWLVSGWFALRLRDRYPEHPKKVDELGARYGVGGSLKRLTDALNNMPG